MVSEVGRRRVFTVVVGENLALTLTAPRKRARVPGPTCARPAASLVLPRLSSQGKV